jgi:type II secretory pathway component PulF
MSTTRPPDDRERGYGLALVGTALHAALVLALLAGFVVFVPRAKRTFDEFGLQVPRLTQTVIRVSNWIAEYWWALVPLFGVLAVIDFLLILWLARRGRFSAPAAWVVAVGLFLVGVGAVVAFAVQEPMIRLREGLAK